MKDNLEELFYPQSVAVVGVSNSPASLLSGRFLIRPLIDFRFAGKIYPVHPSGQELFGLKVYPDIKDIPGPVDYVISAIAAHKTPRLMEDCLALGVKLVTFYTSGFSESSDADGKKLESTLLEIASHGDIRILGPNCMGIYCPESRLSFDSGFSKESGQVAFISQSGNFAFYIIREAACRGVRFSKVVSYGNAGDINETELLRYLAEDDETKIITAYIEGVKEGRKFLQVVKEVAALKPVIILKGGFSESGARGALSHTGSLAGADIIWTAISRQSGVIRVFSPEELVDMMVSFSYPRPQGKRAAIIGFSGGFSIQAADECEKAGLSVPPLSQKIKGELGKSALAPGSFFKNPIDIVGNFAYPEEMIQIIRIIADWEEIDFLLLHFILGAGGFGFEDLNLYNQVLQRILDAVKALDKPVVFVLGSINSPFWQGEVFHAQQECLAAGFPVYPSVGQAAQAINRTKCVSAQ